MWRHMLSGPGNKPQRGNAITSNDYLHIVVIPFLCLFFIWLDHNISLYVTLKYLKVYGHVKIKVKDGDKLHV